MDQSTEIHKRLETLLDAFDTLGNWSARYQHLVDMGRDLEGLEPEKRTPDSFIEGCLSPVWLQGWKEVQGGVALLRLQGDAEGVLPRGLVALTEYFFDGVAFEAVANWKEELGALLALDRHLTPTRAAAFRNLQERVKLLAQKGMADE